MDEQTNTFKEINELNNLLRELNQNICALYWQNDKLSQENKKRPKESLVEIGEIKIQGYESVEKISEIAEKLFDRHHKTLTFFNEQRTKALGVG